MKKLALSFILSVWAFLGFCQCNQYFIYESFSTSLPTQKGTWINTSVLYGTTSTTARTGANYLTFNALNDAIRLPQVTNPGVLSFYYRRSSTSTGTPKFSVETSPDGSTWTERLAVTTFTTSYQLGTVNLGSLGLTNIHIRIIDKRASGSAERYIDDLSLTSTSASVNTLIPFVTACNETLNSSYTYTITDDCGPVGPAAGNYSPSVNRTFTFTPSDNTKKLNLSFTQMDLETNYDYLYVYDGANTSATLLATLNGTTLPSDITATNPSGQLTIRWTSDVSNIGTWGGFAANITSITVCTTPTNGGTLSSNKSSTVVNDAVSLTTTGNGGSITKIEWSYNNFTSVAGSQNNPANPYNIALNVQETSIYFRTTSKDGTCPSGNSNIVEIYLESAPPYTTGVTDGDYITNVTLSNINNNSTNDGDAYQNFTSQIIELVKGSSYTLSASATNTLNPGQGYSSWIDWNNDGIFQTSENIMQKAPSNTTSQNFTVPETSVTGDVKMRILSAWNATPSNDAYYSVGYGYGEIEEYTVRIGVPLPVELVSFTTNCNESGILITWKTASENNSSHFILEKSRDGLNWKQIYTEQAAVNSNELITYNFTDASVIEGINYYRLKQYDLDGVYENFGPISIDCLEESDGYFSVFPNPSSNSFSVIINNDLLIGECILNITDEMGKSIYDKRVNVNQGINLYFIEKLEIKPGIYYISIRNDHYTTAVIKQIVR